MIGIIRAEIITAYFTRYVYSSFRNFKMGIRAANQYTLIVFIMILSYQISQYDFRFFVVNIEIVDLLLQFFLFEKQNHVFSEDM